MNIDFSALKTYYKNGMDALLAGVGRDVTLYFEETVTNIDDANYDSLRDGLRKPNYKPNAPTVTTSTKSVRALVKFNPKDFNLNVVADSRITTGNTATLRLDNPNAVMRLKTKLDVVPDLIRARYIIPNELIVGVVKNRYSLIREPMPFGFGTDWYAISYWRLM